MDRAAIFILVLAAVSGCSKGPPANSSTEVVEAVTISSYSHQSASQRLRAVKWVGLGKDGARQTLKFSDSGEVTISVNHPQRGLITHSYIYRIVKEEGDRLTLHFADHAGTSVSGIQASVARSLEFPAGGAFEISGRYDAE